ncbi:MAG: zinc-binding dehydrogenase [Halobacteria archaeon]
MKQVFLDGDGQVRIEEVPDPEPRPGFAVVRNAHSVVSRGTEARAVAAASEGLFAKLRKNPGLAREMAGAVLREGPKAVIGKLQESKEKRQPLGYSCAGEVTAVGEGVSDLKPGDRVACGGVGYACHAEMVAVPRNLAARVPPGLPQEEAAFTTLGAIGLHALRQGKVQVGERAVVVGLGLVGQVLTRLLIASGAFVFGAARKGEAVERARRAGGDGALLGDPGLADAVTRWSGGAGADALFLCTSGGGSDLLTLAGGLLRPRGRLVVVGNVEWDLQRAGLFAREIEVVGARGYGPGRYDPLYEEGGVDYPFTHVRWTANRNMEAFLDLLARGRVDVKPLVTDRFPLERAAEAYRRLGQPGVVGVLLDYPK